MYSKTHNFLIILVLVLMAYLIFLLIISVNRLTKGCDLTLDTSIKQAHSLCVRPITKMV